MFDDQKLYAVAWREWREAKAASHPHECWPNDPPAWFIRFELGFCEGEGPSLAATLNTQPTIAEKAAARLEANAPSRVRRRPAVRPVDVAEHEPFERVRRVAGGYLSLHWDGVLEWHEDIAQEVQAVVAREPGGIGAGKIGNGFIRETTRRIANKYCNLNPILEPLPDDADALSDLCGLPLATEYDEQLCEANGYLEILPRHYHVALGEEVYEPTNTQMSRARRPKDERAVRVRATDDGELGIAGFTFNKGDVLELGGADARQLIGVRQAELIAGTLPAVGVRGPSRDVSTRQLIGQLLRRVEAWRTEGDARADTLSNTIAETAAAVMVIHKGAMWSDALEKCRKALHAIEQDRAVIDAAPKPKVLADVRIISDEKAPSNKADSVGNTTQERSDDAAQGR